jgi:quinol monooxygenase YgiN
MAVKFGVLALLNAKPDKGRDLAELLQSARSLAVAEEGTVAWYAFRVDDTTYGIFDTFENAEARNAHLEGEIPAALASVGPDLLANDPDIRLVEIVAVK